MTKPRHHTSAAIPHWLRPTSGFSLIEVLIALAVLSVGLAGLATLILTGIKSNESALLRSQATTFAYDIIDRMRANRGTTGLGGTALAGAYDNVTITSDTSLSAGAMAETDLYQWQQALAGSSLPGWTAGVRRLGGNLFLVAVSWDDGRARDPDQAAGTSCLDDSDLDVKISQVCITTQL